MKMKEFIKIIEDEISAFETEPISLEFKNLATIKYVLVKLSNICSRDDRFFLFKENIALRRKIYNKHLFLNKKRIFVSCKSYCLLVQKILKELGVETTLFSAGQDEFKHFALLYIYENKKYYIDPLHDLVNFKIGAKTQYFCSEYTKIADLTVLDGEKQQILDRLIKYDDCYNKFLENFDAQQGIGEIDKSIKSIMFNSSLISVADSIIFLNKLIDDISFQNKEKIKISFCRTLKNIQLQDKIKIMKGTNGVCIQYMDEIIYYFPLQKIFIKRSFAIKDIYIKPKYKLSLYKYLRDNNVNRQILDNIFFQKLFIQLEKKFNLNDKDISIIDGEVCVKKLNLKFFIYKRKYLCVMENNGDFYYKITLNGKFVKKYVKVKHFTKRALKELSK